MTPHTLPPQSVEAEELLIGACMYGGEETIVAALDHVRSKDFYRRDLGNVFKALCETWAAGEPVDALTVAARLGPKATGELGGPAGIAQIGAGGMRTKVNVYARTVQTKARLRALIDVCRQGLDMAYSEPVDLDEKLDQFEAQVFDLVHTDNRTAGALTRIGAELLDHLTVLEERRAAAEAGQLASGLSTGLVTLDRVLNGMSPGGVYVIAGEPGSGKSSLAMDIVVSNASKGVPSIVFNQEMSRAQVLDRFIASQIGPRTSGGITGSDLRNGRLDDADMDRVRVLQAQASDWPLVVVKQAAMSPMEMRRDLRKFQAMCGGVGLAAVDYLQLMAWSERVDSRAVEVTKLSGAVKALAMDFDIPIIELAQLNRNGTSQQGVRPRMTDLKDSSAIEQDAEAVMLIYRDDLHNPASEKPGVAEVIVDKNRNGETGKVDLRYIAPFTTFRDLDAIHTPPSGRSASEWLEAATVRPAMGDDGSTPNEF